ncbi:hypothetical protein BB559_000584 [Furculomyces boomerangus]|uniref:Mediator of RNA polymerase II transcription subunit 22 n=2 Tax=Harpellales TaxID=61421 RepID=A0A2T9Z4Q2_9FUNG|nr:hypothetical protein BB559_000584 [Furculomyces boomerangus]PWA00177.1 hypothetical protein BB558_003766 [Smittium angustum]PWA01530.1 hypothetical protein BB558_002378 [Smittium angustum]
MFQKAKKADDNQNILTKAFKESRMQQQENEFNLKVNLEIENISNSLKTIAELCKVQDKDKFQVSQEAFQVQIRSVTMVKSAESLLKMISSLEKAYLVNDNSYMLEILNKRNEIINDLILETKNEISLLNDQLEAAIKDMERVYLE